MLTYLLKKCNHFLEILNFEPLCCLKMGRYCDGFHSPEMTLGRKTSKKGNGSSKKKFVLTIDTMFQVCYISFANVLLLINAF